jgi:glyoxalase family protein
MNDIKVNGIHHVTAIAGDPQTNLDFYTKLLGLRFLKKTVNFDDPFTYHLYYGDETGSPGTILTFFPWSTRGFKGKKGAGQITIMSFSIPFTSLSFWTQRLKGSNITFTGSFKRFEDEILLLEDPDGFEIELIASKEEERMPWQWGEIPSEHSIRGFHSITLSEKVSESTGNFMINSLGFKKHLAEGSRIRYSSGDGGPGKYIDILSTPDLPAGRMGIGAVHHVAFRTENDESQIQLREKLLKNNIDVTPVIDRNYFHSIYFNEPGNVICEIATDPPGFLIDESKNELGQNLKLPAWYEAKRKEIEKILPKLTVPSYSLNRQ